MKKLFFLVSITSIIVIFMILFLNDKKEYLFIGNNDIYFGMAKSNLTKKIGKPSTVNDNAYDTLLDEYVYIEEIERYDAHCNYFFYKSRLVEMDITIDNIDYNTALSLTENFINKQKEYYSIHNGYFLSEIETDNNTRFRVSNGVNFGATCISFDYEYSFGSLSISAVKQE